MVEGGGMAERPDEVAQQRGDGGLPPPHVDDDDQPGRRPTTAGPTSPTTTTTTTPANRPPTWVAMSGLGFEFVGAILLPGAVGWWLDRRFDTAPWIMLVLGLLGFAAGLRVLLRAVNRPTTKR